MSRLPGDTTDSRGLLAAFADRFRRTQWPGQRQPRLYYDPRSLLHGVDERSVLHAKVTIADATCVLVGSANLTEAAMMRNIEIGVLIELPSVVQQLRSHIEALVHRGVLIPAPMSEG